MSQNGILLGNRAVGSIKCVDAFDEPSSLESDEDLNLMRILMQTWGLCGCSAEDGVMEYVPKKTSARKSSAVYMSSARVCSVNLWFNQNRMNTVLRHCIIASQYMFELPKTVGILEYTGHN